MLFGIYARAIQNTLAANGVVIEQPSSGNTVKIQDHKIVASSQEVQHELIEQEAIKAAEDGFRG